MKNFTQQPFIVFLMIVIITIIACSAPGLSANPAPPAASEAPQNVVPGDSSAATAAANALPTFALPTPTAELSHVLIPATNITGGKVTHDVVSVDTASEHRAPYGDSYQINRFERPFTQADMTYIPDLDIASMSISKDEKFYYVSIELVGTNPNNDIGIDYLVELDTNADGFGDYAIVAHPPYSIDWTTDNVQVLQDKNHDTGGLSAEKSDAPLPGDGYETTIFSGGRGPGDDPDLAWVRVNAGRLATVEFAFKIGLAENRFMYGVYSDAGIKDVGKLDYVDRFTEVEAGSPVRDKKYYPIKAVYDVDNVCRDVYGFTGNGEEPQRCPVDIKPEGKPRACEEPPYCLQWDAESCTCSAIKIIPIPEIICLSSGTQIDTPTGSVSVEDLKVGDLVWTLNTSGERVAAPILKVSSPFVEPNHKMTHIVLSDHRELWASPGHPTTDGRKLGDIKPGDSLDGAVVISAELTSYNQAHTYDLLPDGGTGYYWANGVLLGSTLAGK